MWDLLRVIRGNKEKRQNLSSNATLIDSQHLLILYGQSAEELILFDLRQTDELERFPFIIPGALLTNRARILDVMDWIPPQAIVVLYGAEKISAYSDLIRRLPQDAHFYLLENGVKSWRHAKFPMEPIEEFLHSEAPVAWTRDSARAMNAGNGHV